MLSSISLPPSPSTPSNVRDSSPTGNTLLTGRPNTVLSIYVLAIHLHPDLIISGSSQALLKSFPPVSDPTEGSEGRTDIMPLVAPRMSHVTQMTGVPYHHIL